MRIGRHSAVRISRSIRGDYRWIPPQLPSLGPILPRTCLVALPGQATRLGREVTFDLVDELEVEVEQAA